MRGLYPPEQEIPKAPGTLDRASHHLLDRPLTPKKILRVTAVTLAKYHLDFWCVWYYLKRHERETSLANDKH